MVLLVPKRIERIAMLIILAFCALLAAFVPEAVVPIVLVMPLFSCPMVSNKEQWAAFILAVIPGLSLYLFHDGELFYSLSVLLSSLLPMLGTALLRKQCLALTEQALYWTVGMYVTCLCLMLFTLSRALGGDLATGLADLVTQRVRTSQSPGLTLLRLANMGLVNVPTEARSASVISFVFDVGLINQLLLSLRLTVENLVRALLPSLSVQACVLGGLFTWLRVQKFNYSCLWVNKEAQRAAKPDAVRVERGKPFSEMDISIYLYPVVIASMVGSLLLMMIGTDYALMLANLLYAFFQCVVQLLGAATLIALLSHKNPERKTLYGVLAAAAYLLLPMLLFILGMAEQFLHLRAKMLSKDDQMKEE